MRKILISLLFLSAILINSLKAQDFNLDIRNFEQINETEFTFEAYIQKSNSAAPFTLFSYEVWIGFDSDIFNGGTPTLELVGESQLTGVNQPEAVVYALDHIIFYSDSYVNTNVSATHFDDDTEYKIDKFRVQLNLGGNKHHFADIQPDWSFNLSQLTITKALTLAANDNTLITGPEFEVLTVDQPANPYDHNMGTRQMAGYWFEGDGDWDNNLLWNNVTVANKNTLPGPNSNAIINGNVTIPAGVDESLLPDGNGNGGEVTVLTGPPASKYTATLVGEFFGNPYGSVTFVGGDFNGLSSGEFEAGETITILVALTAPAINASLSSDPPGVVFNPQSGALPLQSTFIMPANDVTISADQTMTKGNFGQNDFLVNPNIEKNSNIDNSSKSLLASLTIVTGASLTVDKLFNDSDNGAEAIVVKSNVDGFGYLINFNDDVPATIELFFADTIYHYVSPPILGAKYEILQDDGNPANKYSNFWQWNEEENQWENLNVPYALPDDVMSIGRGYAVAFNPGDQTRVFAGEINTGDIQYAATYTPPYNQKGVNLVGNPYPSPIDADIFIVDNPLLLGGLYFWDQTEQYDGERWDYATYTIAGATIAGGAGNEPNGFIAPMQGFMIRASAATNIVFNNVQRTTDDAYFFKDGEDKSRIWLSVVGPEGDYNEVLAAFHSTGEMGVDRSDALKIKGNDKLALYMILEDEDYVIQGLPPFDPFESYTLPLGIDAGFSGEYTFNARKIENFDPDIEIFLEDREAGAFFDLNGPGNYKVAIEEGDITDRFFLHINGSTSVPVIQPQKSTKVYAIDNVIYLQHAANGNIMDVEVINTIGQSVVSAPVNASEATIAVPGRNVVYIVKVRTTEGVESHKVLIR